MELISSKCSICSFQLVRTSEIQFAFFEGVEVGEGGLNELSCEAHGGKGCTCRRKNTEIFQCFSN